MFTLWKCLINQKMSQNTHNCSSFIRLFGFRSGLLWRINSLLRNERNRIICCVRFHPPPPPEKIWSLWLMSLLMGLNQCPSDFQTCTLINWPQSSYDYSGLMFIILLLFCYGLWSCCFLCVALLTIHWFCLDTCITTRYPSRQSVLSVHRCTSE